MSPKKPIEPELLTVDDIRRLPKNDPRRAGALLQDLLKAKKMRGIRLARELGCRPSEIYDFIHARKLVTPDKLDRMQRIMDLNDEEFDALLYARLPVLAPDWYENQPNRKEARRTEAGLLLQSCHRRFGIDGRELAEAAGVSGPVLSKWSSGERIIPEEALGKMIGQLQMANAKLSPDVQWFDAALEQRLRDAVARSQEPIREYLRAYSASYPASTQLGAVAKLPVTVRLRGSKEPVQI